MKLLTNDEIKSVELSILLQFDDFCKKNKLRYFLSGGTLLGAIRHKGFIPWDDDIDVCMPRADYEKFIVNFNSNKEFFKVKSNKLDNMDAPFAKIIDTRTKIISKYYSGNIDTNLWIDIFPVDGLPNNIREAKSVLKKITFYRRILTLINANLGEGRTFFRKYGKYILKPLAEIYGAKRCLDNIESILSKFSYDTSTYVGEVSFGSYGNDEHLLKSEFEKVIYVDFEGYKFPAFSCWHNYLESLYGNYMELPSIDKRKAHEITAYLIDE